MEYSKRFKYNRKIVFAIRWWFVGAVYFFIGWGTSLGNQSTSIDFIISLGICIGLCNSFVVNTIIKMLYNIDTGINYYDKRIFNKIKKRFADIFLAIFIVTIVVGIYALINTTAIKLFNLPDSAVFLPGEPIMFALFYVLVLYLLSFLKRKIFSRGNE